jgi:protein-S-isoprenylcysteine O-methyltransferase Ste14
MYMGTLVLGVSLGLTLGTWLVPAGAIVVFLMLARRTRIEETYLIERFGDQYRAYMTRVGRFFPASRRLARAGVFRILRATGASAETSRSI